ncbi:MAG: YbaB/EbfC family nucleoid-associated protein [Deltaproteobacteria bacterium]|nr:YbaB/EbfC family nucleoid-associated protein [Deltaproteobacteria bacterium]
MDFKDLLKQADQLKEVLKKRQEELGAKEFEGEAGAGMVKAVVNGKQEVLSVTIDPQSAPLNDLPMLEDLIRGAVNAAMEKARAEAQGFLSQFMPGGFSPQ